MKPPDRIMLVKPSALLPASRLPGHKKKLQDDNNPHEFMRQRQGIQERKEAAALQARLEEERKPEFVKKRQEIKAAAQLTRRVSRREPTIEELDDGTDIPPWHRPTAPAKPNWVQELFRLAAERVAQGLPEFDDQDDDNNDAKAPALALAAKRLKKTRRKSSRPSLTTLKKQESMRKRASMRKQASLKKQNSVKQEQKQQPTKLQSKTQSQTSTTDEIEFVVEYEEAVEYEEYEEEVEEVYEVEEYSEEDDECSEYTEEYTEEEFSEYDDEEHEVIFVDNGIYEEISVGEEEQEEESETVFEEEEEEILQDESEVLNGDQPELDVVVEDEDVLEVTENHDGGVDGEDVIDGYVEEEIIEDHNGDIEEEIVEDIDSDIEEEEILEDDDSDFEDEEEILEDWDSEEVIIESYNEEEIIEESTLVNNQPSDTKESEPNEPKWKAKLKQAPKRRSTVECDKANTTTNKGSQSPWKAKLKKAPKRPSTTRTKDLASTDQDSEPSWKSKLKNTTRTALTEMTSPTDQPASKREAPWKAKLKKTQITDASATAGNADKPDIGIHVPSKPSTSRKLVNSATIADETTKAPQQSYDAPQPWLAKLKKAPGDDIFVPGEQPPKFTKNTTTPSETPSRSYSPVQRDDSTPASNATVDTIASPSNGEDVPMAPWMKEARLKGSKPSPASQKDIITTNTKSIDQAEGASKAPWMKTKSALSPVQKNDKPSPPSSALDSEKAAAPWMTKVKLKATPKVP